MNRTRLTLWILVCLCVGMLLGAVVFYHGDRAQPDTVVLASAAYQGDSRIYVPFCITVQGQERCGRALVDTGSAYTLIDGALLNGLSAPVVSGIRVSMGGLAAHETVMVRTQTWATCFPSAMQDVIVHDRMGELIGADAIIGMDYIRLIERDLTIGQLRGCA